MAVHLVKLCVGIDTVKDLKDWQVERLLAMARGGETPELCHRTMHMPRRRDEVLAGGSLYWVIKGFVLARQRILDLKQTTRGDGRACCGIVLDPEIVITRPHPRRAFQGWRYLEVADAPTDARNVESESSEMPSGMREKLRELRLIDW